MLSVNGCYSVIIEDDLPPFSQVNQDQYKAHRFVLTLSRLHASHLTENRMCMVDQDVLFAEF